jgi:hypothetical protein
MSAASLPHLRPLSMGELLDQAVHLYRHKFLTFIAIIAVVQIPLTVLQLVFSLLSFSNQFIQSELGDISTRSPFFSTLSTLGYYAGMGETYLLPVINFILVTGVASAALARAVAGSYSGEAIGIMKPYLQIGPSLLSLLGTFFLVGLYLIGLFIWLLIPVFGWFTGIGMLAFFWAVIVPLIAPITVLERAKVGRSIRRAWDLTRQRFWWTLGFIFILFSFSFIIIRGPTMLINYIFELIIGGVFGSYLMLMVQTLLQALIQLISDLIYLPLQLTAITLFYFDLRIRAEGLDLALLSASESGSPLNLAQITAQAPLPGRSKLVTLTEMSYFMLISVWAIAFPFILIFLVNLLASL